MVNIILDTDFETDCDDVGALCVLHTLAQRRIVNICGVIASVHSPWPAAAIATINAALGRPDIPVGENRTIPNATCYLEHRRNTENRLYHKAIASRQIPHYEVEDAVELYFRLLNQAADSSIIICAIGLMTVLAEVMRCPGGQELIRRKVVRLVSMADGEPLDGCSGFNWNMDSLATQMVIDHWPVELQISPVGTNVLTGETLARLPADNPLRCAYEIWNGKQGFLRPSWDQLTVLAASGVALDKGFLKTVRRGKIIYNASSGKHCWNIDECGMHTCLGLYCDVKETARWIEKLMIEAWMKSSLFDATNLMNAIPFMQG